MHECVICVWWDYDNIELLTYEELKSKVKQRSTYAKWLEDKGLSFSDTADKYGAKLRDYLDRRKSTNLQHFDYCPYCGKKIDWKGLRKNADCK